MADPQRGAHRLNLKLSQPTRSEPAPKVESPNRKSCRRCISGGRLVVCVAALTLRDEPTRKVNVLKVEIQFSPSFAMATVQINPGESLQAEAGAMTGMSGGVEITTKAQGGILGGLKRSVLGGETFFINTFSAASGIR